MKRNFTTCLFLITFFTHLFSQTKTVIQLSQPRTGMGVIAYGDKVICAGGGVPNGNIITHSNLIEIIDGTTLISKQLEMPFSKMNAKIINWENKILLHRKAGFNSSQIDIYDFANNIWESETLTQQLTNVNSELIDNKVYFFNGLKTVNNLFNAPMEKLEIYNFDSKTWQYTTMLEPRYSMISISFDKKLYLLGGKKDTSTNSKRVDIFDTQTNRWLEGNSLIMSRNNEQNNYTLIGSKLIFADGEIYDLSEKKPFSPPHLTTYTYSSAISHWDTAYFAGGFVPNSNPIIPTDTIRLYDAISNTWSFAKLSEARMNVSASKVFNNIVFAGGFNKDGASKAIDIYNTKTGKWKVEKLEEGRTNVKTAVVGNKLFLVDGDIQPLVGLTNPNLSFGFNPSIYVDILEFPIENTTLVSKIELDIFPNPFADELTLRWFPLSDIEGKLRIYNVLGEIVYSSTVQNNKKISDMRNLAVGTYVIYLETGRGILTKKIIKF